MADKTTKEIAQDYTAMGHSVSLITNVIAGDAMEYQTDSEKKTCVARNVEHLELMKAMKKESDDTASIWTNESFTAIDAAISAGNTYTA